MYWQFENKLCCPMQYSGFCEQIFTVRVDDLTAELLVLDNSLEKPSILLSFLLLVISADRTGIYLGSWLSAHVPWITHYPVLRLQLHFLQEFVVHFFLHKAPRSCDATLPHVSKHCIVSVVHRFFHWRLHRILLNFYLVLLVMGC